MKIAFVGHGSMGHRVLRGLLKMAAPVTFVACHDDVPEEQPFLPSVGDLADDAGIEVFQASPSNLPPIPDVDLLISAGYRTILPERLLPARAFNFHASLLPKYRGRCPLNWALINGEERTGVTVHDMHGGVDVGGIAGQTVIDIGPDTNIQTLSLFAEDAAEDLLRLNFEYLCDGNLKYLCPQDESLATYGPARRPRDGRFLWSWPDQRIHNLVRALTRPWPGAFVDEPSGRHFVWKTRLDEEGVLEILDSELR